MIEGKINYQENVSYCLTPQDKQILKLTAKGLTRREMADSLDSQSGQRFGEHAIETHIYGIFRTFGANNEINAVVIGIKNNILDIGELTDGMDKKSLLSLSKKEKITMKTLLENNGKNSPDSEIAKALSSPDKEIKVSTVRGRMEKIYRKLKLNRMQAALLYMSHPPRIRENEDDVLSSRDKKILELIAKGLLYREIADVLRKKDGTKYDEDSIKFYSVNIMKTLGAHNKLNAVIMGIDKGILSLEKLTKDLDEKSLSRLTESDKKIMEIMTRNQGENNSYEEIANTLSLIMGEKVTEQAIRKQAEKIYLKLSKNHIQSALLYLSAKNQPEKKSYSNSYSLRAQRFLNSDVIFRKNL